MCLWRSLSLSLITSPGTPGLVCQGNPCAQVPGSQEEPNMHPHGLFQGEPGRSCRDCRGWSGSLWIHTGAGLQVWPGESMLPAWLSCSTVGQPRGPRCAQDCCALVHGIQPHSLHLQVGTLVEGSTLGVGAPGAAQDPEVSWDPPFHARCSLFDCQRGLGTAPMHRFLHWASSLLIMMNNFMRTFLF